MKRIVVQRCLEAEALRGKHVSGEAPGWTHVEHSCRAFTGDGQFVFAFGKSLLPTACTDVLYANLRSAAIGGTQRKDAAGPLQASDVTLKWAKAKCKMIEETRTHYTYRVPNGRVSKRYARVNSGGVGHVHNRPTGWTLKNMQKLETAMPALVRLSQAYKALAPGQHAQQVQTARGVPALAGTCFSTITVNRNFRTAVHRDDHNVQGSCSVMTVTGDDRVKGGRLLFPEYKVGVDVRVGDVLVFAFGLYHCNAPMVGQHDRVSIVAYVS